MTDLLDYLASQIRRDEGIALVKDNNGEWFGMAMSLVEQWSKLGYRKRLFMGEDIRNWLTPMIGKPKSPHAYGALIRECVKKPYIVETGKWVHMKSLKSNHRRTPEYTWPCLPPIHTQS